MSDLRLARVRSVDLLGRGALVELDGSEGTGVLVQLADGVYPHSIGAGVECVVATTPEGERMVLATLGHDPATAGLPGSASVVAPPASFSYTDGVAWQDALMVDVRTGLSRELWASGWLALRSALAQAATVWQLRVLVDAAGAGPVLGWGSPLSSLEQTCPYGARIAVPGPGLWRVRLQVRVVVAAHSVACLGGQLFAEARKSTEY